MKEYWVDDQGEIKGPFSREQLNQWVEQGVYNDSVMVHAGEDSDWLPYRSLAPEGQVQSYERQPQTIEQPKRNSKFLVWLLLAFLAPVGVGYGGYNIVIKNPSAEFEQGGYTSQLMLLLKPGESRWIECSEGVETAVFNTEQNFKFDVVEELPENLGDIDVQSLRYSEDVEAIEVEGSKFILIHANSEQGLSGEIVFK